MPEPDDRLMLKINHPLLADKPLTRQVVDLTPNGLAVAIEYPDDLQSKDYYHSVSLNNDSNIIHDASYSQSLFWMKIVIFLVDGIAMIKDILSGIRMQNQLN